MPNIKFRVVSGDKIVSWSDTWVGECSLVRSFQIFLFVLELHGAVGRPNSVGIEGIFWKNEKGNLRHFSTF